MIFVQASTHTVIVSDSSMLVLKSHVALRAAGVEPHPLHGCRGAAAAVVVFDITNAESFAKAKNWVKELQRQGNPNMIMALAGNKADLAAQRSVTADEAKVGGSAVSHSAAFWDAYAQRNLALA